MIKSCVMVAVLLTLATGCTPGARPFLMVEMCLKDTAGKAEFIELMKSVAESEQMIFIDGSSDTQKNLNATSPSIDILHQPDGLMHIGAERKDGLGLGAGNLGLAKYQVAVGFSVGHDRKEAQDFANRVVMTLQKHWIVSTVPADAGALPMAGCGD